MSWFKKLFTEAKSQPQPQTFKAVRYFDDWIIGIPKELDMNWLKFFVAILGEAEQIVPVFIHNPKSQQLESVIVTTVNTGLPALLAALNTQGQQPKG